MGTNSCTSLKKKTQENSHEHEKVCQPTEAFLVVHVLFLVFTHGIGKSNKRQHSNNKRSPKILVLRSRSSAVYKQNTVYVYES